MTRWLAALALGLSGLSLVPGAGTAQTLYNVPAGGGHHGDPDVTGTLRPGAPPAVKGQYGGGFIELLVTGRDPSAALAPRRADPLAVRMAPQPDPLLGSPGVIPAPPAARTIRVPALAALPASPGEEYAPIGRALPPEYRRQVVSYDGPHRAGTVVIDTPNRFLYLVQGGGRALRYGIGVGRPGFEWAGMKTVTMKREWPDWRPPPQMLQRRPDLPRHMVGGPANPLGARALYLGSSLYRIHGTNEPHTIGQAVSSGCIRMTNEDVIDLYNRVGVGARVLVM